MKLTKQELTKLIIMAEFAIENDFAGLFGLDDLPIMDMIYSFKEDNNIEINIDKIEDYFLYDK